MFNSNPLKNLFTALLLLSFLQGCKKELVTYMGPPKPVEVPAKPALPFVEYTIKEGEQYCDKNDLTQVEYTEQKFWVRFDSSAVYRTIDPGNQFDINKLYGFSDNKADHHDYSARFGWRWSENALRLFAYVYNSGQRSSQEIGAVAIGKEHYCSIRVAGDHYVFTLNNTVVSMPRTAPMPSAVGYKLFPYFGGDELAPHQVKIWIKELP